MKKRDLLLAQLEDKKLDIQLKQFALEDAKAEIARKQSETELNAVKRDVAYKDPQVFTRDIKRQAERIDYLERDLIYKQKVNEAHVNTEKALRREINRQQELLEYPAVKFVLYLKDKLFTIRTKTTE